MKKTVIIALVLAAGCGPRSGEADRVTCETYCDEMGGFLGEVRAVASSVRDPECVCVFDLVDPE